jgi:hypothetical protein
VGQRAIEQAEVEVDANLVQRAGVPGTADLGGELIDAAIADAASSGARPWPLMVMVPSWSGQLVTPRWRIAVR